MAKHKTKIFIILFGILVLLIALVVLEKTTDFNLINQDYNRKDESAKTTSNSPTAQEDFTNGSSREAGNSIGEHEGSAIVTDNNGTITTTDMNNPTVSRDGQVTVYSPKKNALLINNSEVAGSTTLNKISYRLIDSVSGVISSGEIGVTGGKFSGKINFQTTADTGRLDLFGTKPDGVEFSHAEIEVRFK